MRGLGRLGILLASAACGRVSFDAQSDVGDLCPPASPRSNPRSIGTNTSTLATGTASIHTGTCVVTFESALPPGVGPGDRLDIAGEILFVWSRDSDTQVTVAQPAQEAHVADIARLHRAYDSIGAWYAERQGDLVLDDRTELGITFSDGPLLLTDAVTIDGSNTDATHFFRLTAAPGHRHHGRPGTGVLIDGQSASCGGIDIVDDHTIIEHLELVRFNPEVGCGPAALLVRGRNILLTHLLVHDYATAFSNSAAAVRLAANDGTASATIRNLIAFGGKIGIRVPQMTGGHLIVEHCTIYAMSESGIEVATGGGTLAATNTIAMQSGGADFAASTGGLTQLNNLSSDDTAAGLGSLTSIAPGSIFISLTPGAEDLHLSPQAPAIDRGISLVSASDDIDEEPRPKGGTSDVGADEH